jgi:hypothetical protein
MQSVLIIFYITLLNQRVLVHPDNHNEDSQFVICGLLGYYAAYSDDSLSTFWDYLTVPCSEVWTDRLSRKVGKELTLYAV